MATMPTSVRAKAHAIEAERTLDAIATKYEVASPETALAAVQAQALTSIALSLAALISATNVGATEQEPTAEEA